MNVRTLFPRPLAAPSLPEDSHSIECPLDHADECAAILGALFVRAYFDRSVARKLGWRGILPNSSGLPAWTCRVAGSEHTFGIAFDSEHVAWGSSTSSHMPDTLRGMFHLFVFPDTDAPVLDSFPLQALSMAMQLNYPHVVRSFAQFPEQAAPFRAGTLFMDLKLDGSGLALELEAPARERIIALDGVPSGSGDYVVAPGQAEADFPAFRLLLPVLAALAASLEEIFGELCRLTAGHAPSIPRGFDRHGHVRALPELKGVTLRMRAALGDDAHGGEPLPHRLAALPLHAERGKNVVREDRPVLHILGGFLGSGKTTLLKEWLNFLHDKNRFTGVLQNEFGAVGLDALLLQGEAVVEQLEEGCVCCSLADSLRPGLLRLMKALPAREFILETSGLANPLYVLEAARQLVDLIIPGLVVIVVDALDLASFIIPEPTSQNGRLPSFEGVRLDQIRAADVLVINKTDAVTEPQLAIIERELAVVNPTAEMMRTVRGRIPFARIDALYAGLYAGLEAARAQPAGGSGGGAGTNHPHTHVSEGYSSRLLEFPGPVSRAALHAALRDCMPGVCRIKGLVEIENEGLTTVQYAAGLLKLEPCENDASRAGYLVLIGNGSQG